MSARHAGFAVVLGVGEALINDLIEAAFQHLVTPLTFHLPTPIMVGSTAVTFAGAFTILPPVATFVQRPDNLVGVRCRSVAELRLDGATEDPVDVLIELGCSLLVGLSVNVVNGRFQVGLDLSQAAVTGLDVTILDGPSLHSAYGAAIHSGPVLAVLTAALRAIPPELVRTTVDGFPAVVRLAPRAQPCGASLFEPPPMFDASFAVVRVVPRPLDGQLAIGVDIAGITWGDPNGLVSLFGAVRGVWIRTSNPDGPIDFRPRGVSGGGNLAISVNPDALVALLEGPLTGGTYHAFVDCHVALEGLSLSYGTFTPNLWPPWWRVEGPTFHVGARYYDSPGRDAQSRLIPGGVNVRADVHAPFAIHYQMFDGPTDFVSDRGEYWYVQVYDVEVDLPWWVSAGLVLAGITLPGLWLPVAALLDGILPSLLGNIGSRVQRNAQSGINGVVSAFGLAPREQTITLPSLPRTPVRITNHLLSFTGEGLELYATYWLATQEDTSPDRHLIVTVGGTRVRDGNDLKFGIVDPRPVPCAVKLKAGLASPFDMSVRVSWEVRRKDTNQVIFQQDLPYASPVSDMIGLNRGGPPPGANTPRKIVIDRTSPALAAINEFSVSLRVYRPLFGRVKEFGSSRFSISIEDRFDRSHPYVRWKGWAAGMPKESAIHRTAAPGRCSMIMRAAPKAKFEYLDELPFPKSQLNDHRKELCEYCFFGGPDKFIPLI